MEVASGELESVHTDIRALRGTLGLPPRSDINLFSNTTSTSLPNAATIAAKVQRGDSASFKEGDISGSAECSDVKEENIRDDIDTRRDSSHGHDGSNINNFDENQFNEELKMTFDGFDFNFFTPPILLLVDELAFLERDLDLLSARTAAQKHFQVQISFLHEHIDC